ncbi:MAG: hypothetical protein ACM31P_02775 [Actinomycetota bacterium]
MSELDRLHRLLLRHRNLDGLAQGSPEALDRLAAASRALSPPRGHLSPSRVAKGVMSFRIAQRNTAYPELKYACYGLARPVDWEGRILLAEMPLLTELLSAVAALGAQPRHFSQCYRGLLTAWLGVMQREVGSEDDDYLAPGTAKLKRFLLDHRGNLARLPRKPGWAALVLDSGLEKLAELSSALQPRPTSRPSTTP